VSPSKHWKIQDEAPDQHDRGFASDEVLMARKRDVFAAFCGKQPPLELMRPERSDALQQWVLDNLHPWFGYASGISIMDAADSVARSQVENGYEYDAESLRNEVEIGEPDREDTELT
jgi:hypothetical protein